VAFVDKSLTCVECGASFAFTGSEQELFASRGYTNEPKRCPSCREARRGRTGAGAGAGGGGGSYSFARSAPRQMYPAVCAQCGQSTQVPFQPRGDRPVYCSTCFSQQRGSSSYR
jgi:CxxC-x17-CxxC domain-containing protein